MISVATLCRAICRSMAAQARAERIERARIAAKRRRQARIETEHRAAQKAGKRSLTEAEKAARAARERQQEADRLDLMAERIMRRQAKLSR